MEAASGFPGRADVEFCGEHHVARPGQRFTIGRAGDLVLDDGNRFLHRRLLELQSRQGLWWLANVGSRLAVTIADGDGTLEAWLAPGAALPLVVPQVDIRLTAGPTTYQLSVAVPVTRAVEESTGSASHFGAPTTIGKLSLTPDQRRLVVALVEPVLREPGSGRTLVPASGDLARRLGWTITKFNRKLDNVCDRLARQGVRGLHGGPGALATSRRNRLAEYALASRLVTTDDLGLLD